MRLFLIALVVVSVVLPAFGKTHVIKVLGTEPLFGTCSSRDQFFALMRRYPERETLALNALGLDRAEFERGMRSAQNVTTGGPLHLDAMAYYWGGVKVVRDVQLPPHTRLWVSHLSHRTVYVPQVCGNISTVAVAAVGAYREAFPVTARTHPTTPFAGAVGPRAALATSPALGVTPPSVESPKAVAGVPTTGGGVPPGVHHAGFPWWIFLIPVALIHGGGGSSGGGAHVPIVLIPPGPSSSPSPSPSPTRTPCPKPSPKPSPTPCPSRC